MAQLDALLQLDGIKGETDDKEFPGAIEILNWNWGMTSSAASKFTSAAARAQAMTKVSVRDIRFTKRADSASPALAAACCLHQNIKTATLAMRKAGGESVGLTYYKVKLGDIYVSSFDQTGQQNGDLIDEVTINFVRFDIEYSTQLETGGSGFGTAFNWDLSG